MIPCFRQHAAMLPPLIAMLRHADAAYAVAAQNYVSPALLLLP